MRRPKPTDTPATGDVLTINGIEYRLVAIINAGGPRTGARFYRFKDPTGRTLDVQPKERKSA